MTEKENNTGNLTINSPRAFPAPGKYEVPQTITLMSHTPGAVIHYTRDGSAPDLSSPVFDPYRLIPMYEFGQQVPSETSVFNFRAIAVVGDQSSEERTFAYELNPRGKEVYLSHAVAPGVRMILDYQNDKMYLVTGSQRCLLIDAGMGGGDLRGYIEAYTGGLPIDVAITHGHPDHIAKMGQFQVDCDVYMNLADIPMIKNFVEHMHYEIDPEKIKDLREGFVFDLGNRKLRVYEVPGHTKGCVVLLDEENRILFSGDAIGSNQPTIVDALWMQNSANTVDEYLSTLQVFRAKIGGKVKVTFGGHNMIGSVGEAYLDNLQAAAQKLVDEGIGVLTPAPRPTGVWQVVYGDRLTDLNWAAINVNKDKCLSAPPDKIASLSNLELKGGCLDAEFRPAQLSYTATVEEDAALFSIIPTTTSSRYAALKINGVEAKSGSPFAVWLEKEKEAGPFAIEVTSPDGTVTATYTVKFR
jgi:glyoxylase-like metal-dependent hydrolase (beta-lactamase superfamily II)